MLGAFATGCANTENILSSTFSSPSSTHTETTLLSTFDGPSSTHAETTLLSTFDRPSSTHTENALPSSFSRPSTPSSVSSEGSSYLERWDENDVKLLISCYSELKHLLGKGKHTKREVFAKIAFNFNKKAEHMVTGDQCLRKWNKLESNFKKVEDHNKKTGNDKKTMKYFDQLQACIGSDPNINPVISLESGHVSGNDSSDDDESGELSSTDGKPKKRPVRKRKSHSSAAEMLEFMNRYAEKREKVEEEKLNLMREMQNEKKMFFSQYLEIMRNK